ncbi:MAG: PAS domain S-box protein, partial [Syntrophorhabdaceae bacterium]|nr:PAS domain S-box protein [Syntrophorhabdaceae bacterium]
MEGPDPLIRLQGTIEGKLQEKLRSIHSYKGLPEQESLRIVRGFLDPLFADLSGHTKNSFVRHIKGLLKRSAEPGQIKQILETLSVLEAAIKPHVKNVKIVISLWDILSAARTQLTEHALRHSIPADISERRNMEEALRASEERYRALVEGANEFIVVLQDGKMVYANPKMLHDASMSMQKFSQRSFTDFIYKDDLPLVINSYRKRLEGDTTHHTYSFRIVDNAGEIRWMQASSIPITWDQRPAILVLLIDISRLKQVEEALQRSEQKIREISSSIPGVVYQFYARDNGDRGFYYVSGQSMKLFGISPEPEGFFERFTELVLPEYRESFLTSNDNAIRTVSEWQFEGKLQKPSGEIIWFRGNSVPCRQENETIFNGIVLDITEQKRSEEALKESEKKFRDIAQLTPQIIYEIDAERRLTFVNKEAERMLGLTGEDVRRGLDIFTLFPPEEHSRVRRYLEQMIQGDSTHGNEYTMVRKDGTTIPVIAYSSPIFRNGNIAGFRGTIIDITEHKKTEQALQESEMKYRNIFENAVEGFFQSTPEGRFLSVNPAMATTCGYTSPEEMINSITELGPQFYVYPEDRNAFMERMEAYGIDEDFEHQVYRKDGSIIWISSKTRAVRDDSGKIIFYEGTNEDITKRKNAEAALTASELFLKQTQSIARLGGWKANPHTDYLEWTDGIYEIVEAPRDYRPGLAEGLQYFLPQYIPFIRDKIINCLATGETFVIEAEVITETGKKLWTEVRGLAPIVEGGRSYVAGTLQDITERKQLASQLFQAQKMEAVGTLAGGVAHDFNNILSAIMGYASLLQLKIDRDSPLSSYVAQILTSSERAAQLTQSLLAFSRKQKITMKPFSLNDAITNIQKLLTR